jgi:hypothetical protein
MLLFAYMSLQHVRWPGQQSVLYLGLTQSEPVHKSTAAEEKSGITPSRSCACIQTSTPATMLLAAAANSATETRIPAATSCFASCMGTLGTHSKRSDVVAVVAAAGATCSSHATAFTCCCKLCSFAYNPVSRDSCSAAAVVTVSSSSRGASLQVNSRLALLSCLLLAARHARPDSPKSWLQ